jgi:transposase
MRTLDIPGYTEEALQEIAKSNPDYQVGIRLLALIQIKKGLPSRKLEDIFQVSHTRYCQWVKSFNKDGIEGLKNKPKSGRRPKLNQQQLERIKDTVLNTSPMAHGFNTATWNGPLIREFIKQDMGVDFKKAQVYNILKGQGLTYQKAKGKYPEADAALKEEMSKEIKKNTRRT